MKTEEEIRGQLAELVKARLQKEQELVAIDNQEYILRWMLGEIPEPAPLTECDRTEQPPVAPAEGSVDGNGTPSDG